VARLRRNRSREDRVLGSRLPRSGTSRARQAHPTRARASGRGAPASGRAGACTLSPPAASDTLDTSAAAPEWRRTLAVMGWPRLLAVSGISLTLPFLPLLVRSLGVTDEASVQRWSGAIYSGPFLFAALMTPIWGWMGDRFGRKPMVVRALVG